MHVTRFAEARPYEAPGHFDMRMLRLQGHEAGPSSRLWIGLSHLLPGGNTAIEASPKEKIYVVLAGELTIENGTDEATLVAWDTCRIAPGEPRRLVNRTNAPATVLLAMALDAGAAEPPAPAR